MVGLIGSALVLGAVFGAALGGSAPTASAASRVFLVDMAIIALARPARRSCPHRSASAA